MNPKDLRVGMKVYDRWHPEVAGIVVKVLKTRVHVYFTGNIRHTSYDWPHTREFLVQRRRKKK